MPPKRPPTSSKNEGIELINKVKAGERVIYAYDPYINAWHIVEDALPLYDAWANVHWIRDLKMACGKVLEKATLGVVTPAYFCPKCNPGKQGGLRPDELGG